MHGDSSTLNRCLKCNARNPTIHITLKTSAGFVTIDLCAKCQPNVSVDLDVRGSSHQIRCPRCGISLAEITANGRLGCSDDYLTFSTHIARGLKKYHGSDRHVGKAPRSR